MTACHPPRLARLLALVATLGLFAPAASAQVALGGDGDRKARVELISSHTAVRPGQTVDVGVKFTLEPTWHIYWKNPGDAGQPPAFNWNLPGGGASQMLRGGEWQATAPRFPAPITFTDAGGISTYGYKETVVFPATVTVPASATPGQTAELTLATDYLVCDPNVCLPESATATLALEVSTDEQRDEEAAGQIDAAKAAVPTPAELSSAVRTNLKGDGTGYVLEVDFGRPMKDVGFFPDPPQGLVVEAVTVQAQGPTATITFRPRALAGFEIGATEFEAVVGYDTPQGRRGVTVKVPVPPSARQE